MPGMPVRHDDAARVVGKGEEFWGRSLPVQMPQATMPRGHSSRRDPLSRRFEPRRVADRSQLPRR